MKTSLQLALPILAISLFASCGESVNTGGPRGQTAYLPGTPARTDNGNSAIDTVSYWDGDGVQGAPKIQIDISDQKAYYYKGSELVGVSMISTGRSGFDTPTGSFKITQKSPDHRSNLYGEWITSDGTVIDNDVDVRKKPTPPPGAKFVGASMPHFLRFNGGVGMHAGFLPGFPASHGCVRMPAHMAKRFFNESPSGTPVIVTR